MDDFVMPLMLALDVSSLTMSLVNIAAPDELADSVEAALRPLTHLDVQRDGDTVVARTDAGHPERVVVVARLGPVASTDAMAYVEMGRLVGPGASDAKGALAMTLKAAAVGDYRCDVTFVFQPGGRDALPAADFALLAEPTGTAVVGEALDHPWTRRLIELTDVEPSSGPAGGSPLGVPTVSFGPGDPSLAGSPDEYVRTAELAQCEFVLRTWLTAD